MKVPIPFIAATVAVISGISRLSIAQSYSTPEQAFAAFFEEARAAESKHFNLWDRDMYGPILVVNPQTREVYANFPDAGGALTRSGDIFEGHLPEEININNTIVYWNGREWAMVMLPLPNYRKVRIGLFAHELFHVVQPSLGFRGYSPDNSHLDEKNGRILLRLELEALRKALETPSTNGMKKCLTDAMTFREYRYLLYPQAKFTENLLELNEGLAEYTGLIVSDMTREEAVYFFERSINAFVRYPTFVRSFAYETIPVYGYLLRQTDRCWNKDIAPNTNLSDYFIHAFGLNIPSHLPSAERAIEDRYDGMLIHAEETNRESIRIQQIATYRKEFINQSHVEIKFEKMHLTFDPRDVIPLDDKGNVYPTIRVIDEWGILDVQNGALMSPRWDKIIVSAPTNIDGPDASGNGWTLKLNSGYRLVEDYATGNYILTRQKSIP